MAGPRDTNSITRTQYYFFYSWLCSPPSCLHFQADCTLVEARWHLAVTGLRTLCPLRSPRRKLEVVILSTGSRKGPRFESCWLDCVTCQPLSSYRECGIGWSDGPSQCHKFTSGAEGRISSTQTVSFQTEGFPKEN